MGKPQTLNPKPQAPNSKPQTPNPEQAEAESDRDLHLKKASYETQVNRANAEAKAAGEIENAKQQQVNSGVREVDVGLPGKGNYNSHGARPVHLIITMIKWIRTSRLLVKNSLSLNSGVKQLFSGTQFESTIFHFEIDASLTC